MLWISQQFFPTLELCRAWHGTASWWWFPFLQYTDALREQSKCKHVTWWQLGGLQPSGVGTLYTTLSAPVRYHITNAHLARPWIYTKVFNIMTTTQWPPMPPGILSFVNNSSAHKILAKGRQDSCVSTALAHHRSSFDTERILIWL